MFFRTKEDYEKYIKDYALDVSNAHNQRKKDPNWKRIVTTSNGIILNEGDYYILRNGTIVYLMDSLSMSDRGTCPFYMRSKGTGEVIGCVDWDGKHVCQPWFSDCDIVGVYDRPSLNTANMI